MKSISNSDPIYAGIACQKSIPRFLLISVKYLWLSTFPKVADLIGARSLTASHSLWQDGGTASTSQGHSGAPGSHLFPSFLYGGRWQEMNSLNQGPACSRVCKQGRDHSTFSSARNCQDPLHIEPCAMTRSNENALAGHGRPPSPRGPFGSLFPADFSVDRCLLLAAAKASWQEDSNLSSQK